MKAMQSLVKIPEIQATMRELSKEMMKVTGLVVLSLQNSGVLSWGCKDVTERERLLLQVF
jgi:hypothetical protein